MNESPTPASPFTTQEVRLYFVVLAAFLVGLFLFNVFALRPPLSSNRIALYALLTLLLLLAYGYVFAYESLSFPPKLRRATFWLLVEGAVMLGIVGVLNGRATPYLFLFVFDVYSSAITLQRRTAFLITLAVIIMVALGYGVIAGGDQGWRMVGTNLFWITAAVFLAELFVRQWRQRVQVEGLLEELDRAHRQLRRQTERAEELAVLQERARLAQEMHDTVGHTLTALDVQLEQLAQLSPSESEPRRRLLSQARSLVKEGLADARRAVQALRPLALEIFDLPEAVNHLISEFQRATGIAVDWETEGDLTDLPSSRSVPLYRAVQESLTNVRRHAPAATRVMVRLRRTAAAVYLTVENDGVGSRPAADDAETIKGYGLRGLHERAESLGGTFTAHRNEQGIFRVEMDLPLSE